jgi:hypothetical protein
MQLLLLICAPLLPIALLPVLQRLEDALETAPTRKAPQT